MGRGGQSPTPLRTLRRIENKQAQQSWLLPAGVTQGEINQPESQNRDFLRTFHPVPNSSSDMSSRGLPGTDTLPSTPTDHPSSSSASRPYTFVQQGYNLQSTLPEWGRRFQSKRGRALNPIDETSLQTERIHPHSCPASSSPWPVEDSQRTEKLSRPS